MAKRLELQIQGSAGNFAFDVEGEWTPRIEPVYRAASEPPRLERLTYTWEFRGCRLKGATATLWTNLIAFFGRFEDADEQPTYLRLIRDPSGAAVEVMRLGNSDHQGLRFSLIEGESDRDVTGATWGTSAPFTIVASADRLFPDDNGIALWDQEVSVRYDNGLRILEWVTQIGTEEGAATSALDLAKAHAAIDISSLPTYTYETNGPDGIEWEEIDADEINSRVATQVSAVSRVREWGVTIGASGGGVSPDSVSLTISTQTTSDEVVTTTLAEADGPNSEQWVISQRPGGDVSSELLEERRATNGYSGRWEQKAATAVAAVTPKTTTRVVVSGGGRAVRITPIAGGLPPIVQRGAFQSLTAEVSVLVERQGGTGLPSELPFPPLLGSPWILDTASSKEGSPEIEEHGVDATQHRWKREASLVYMSPSAPSAAPSAELAQGGPVSTYLLGS